MNRLPRSKKPLKRTPMKKYSEKQREKWSKRKVRALLLNELYQKVWQKRQHICESCGKWLGEEIRITFFDHLLEKSSYPEYEFDENNIFLCCWDCHSLKTNGHPLPKHAEAILAYKTSKGYDGIS